MPKVSVSLSVYLHLNEFGPADFTESLQCLCLCWYSCGDTPSCFYVSQLTCPLLCPAGLHGNLLPEGRSVDITSFLFHHLTSLQQQQ